MERLKTLSKKAIIEAVKEGAVIQWDIIPAKAYVVGKDGKRLGAIRMETYLRLDKKRVIRSHRLVDEYTLNF